MGTSHPPYTEWDWKDTGTRLGGPHMLQLPDDRIVAAVRLYDQPVRTSLCWVNPETAEVSEFLKLLRVETPVMPDWSGTMISCGSVITLLTKENSIYLAKVKIPLK
ncbi:MAG: hypothetical protein R3C11_08675 [Planctomycetaceae bacterium]